MAGDESDLYVSQSANLRDTAKWMAVGYAAIAAVVIAGAPFAAISGLELYRLVIVGGAAFLAMAAFLLALNDIVKFLIGDPCFASGLSEAAKTYINDHALDILPARFATFADFYAARQKARLMARGAGDQLAAAIEPGNAANIQLAQQVLSGATDVAERYEDQLNRLVSEAHLHQLQQALNALRGRLACYTVAGAILLFVAVWAAKPHAAAFFD